MLPKRLKSMTAFVDGIGYAGRVEEIGPPKLALKMEEYRAAGMDAPVELDMGMEKMECSITFTEYDDQLFTMFGLVDGNAVSLTVRGTRQDDTSTDGIIMTMRGTYKELDPGTWKPGDKGTLKAVISCRYYKLTIADKELVEIDIENMIRKINGKDQLAEERKAL
ncbi:MAG: phage major tail tube protein, partial [Desulfobacteraceae bacterium]|nr:phage major tail tube protein [Desulfobacteraceae bacterium]